MCADVVYPSVCNLFNLSLSSGKFFAEWKDANLSPVYKKGSKALFSNYRGISLLPYSLRCLRNVLLADLLTLLRRTCFPFNIVSAVVYHAPLSYLQCCMILALLLTRDSKSMLFILTSLVPLTLSVTLACFVNSKLLVFPVLFLTGSLTIFPLALTIFPLSSLVPQRSVLGPILFILSIYDLPDCLLSSRIAMFADDTKCYNVIHSPSDVANLQGGLHRISNWETLNKLSFQPVKCPYLRITRKRVSFDRTYSLNNVNLKTVFIRL